MKWKTRTRLIVILFLIIQSTSFIKAQTQNSFLDSLKTRLNDETLNIEQRVNLYKELSYHYYDLKPDSALLYSREGYQLALQVGDSLQIVTLGRITGQTLRITNQFEEAEIFLKRVIGIAKRNNYTSDLTKAMNSLALIYNYRTQYDKALELHFEALQLRENSGDAFGIATSLTNIGFVYYKLRNYEKAIQYYEKAMFIREGLENKTDLEILYINSAQAHIKLADENQQKLAIAIKLIDKGLDKCNVNCSQYTVSIANYAYATAYMRLKDFTKSEYYHKLSYQNAKAFGETRLMADNLVQIAMIYLTANKDYVQAERTLKEALELATQTEYNQVILDIYKSLSLVEQSLNNGEMESFYQSKYIALRDSLFSESLVNNVSKIQARFEERENIKTIQSINDVIKKQKQINIASGVIIVLISGLAFMVYQSNRYVKRVNSQLSDAKVTIEAQHHTLSNKQAILDEEVKKKRSELQIALERLQDVNKELDGFIYSTAHNIRGPLAVLNGMCNYIQDTLEDKDVLQSVYAVDQTIEKVNTIINRLLVINKIYNSRISVSQIHFHLILDNILLVANKLYPFKVEVDKSIQQDLYLLSDPDLIQVILSNLIHNSFKNIDSNKPDPTIKIRIAQEGNFINMMVSDNGTGINHVQPGDLQGFFVSPTNNESTTGLGLYIVKKSVEKLNGRSFWYSKDGYTSFEVIIPSTLEAA